MTDRKIRLVVLDWAGTAVDFGCFAPVDAFVRVFTDRGVEVSVAEARQPMGLHKKDHIREMLSQAPLAERWRVVRGRDWTEADVEELYEAAGPMQLAAIGPNSAPVPGVVDAVKELRKTGVHLAGTTGYFLEAATACFAAAKAHGYELDANICADEVPQGRPAPWMIFRHMERFGVYPPSTVLKVGDTVADIAEGRNAGAWSYGVIDSSSEVGLSQADFDRLTEAERDGLRQRVREKFIAAGAHGTINTMAELVPLVESLNRQLSSGNG